jgi:hypothetical protein
MLESLRRWRPLHLLAAWNAYWLALAVVALWPALMAQLRIVQRPGAGETVNVSYGDGAISATMIHGGVTVWSASIHLATFLLLVAGPPLALWALWLAARRRERTPAAPLAG